MKFQRYCKHYMATNIIISKIFVNTINPVYIDRASLQQTSPLATFVFRHKATSTDNFSRPSVCTIRYCSSEHFLMLRGAIAWSESTGLFDLFICIRFTFHAGEVLVSGKMLETDTYKVWIYYTGCPIFPAHAHRFIKAITADRECIMGHHVTKTVPSS